MCNVLKIPDNDDFHERRSDARRIAPYLLRFYASISNPNALALSEKIIELLVGQIVWPRGATARVSALLKRQDRSLRSRNLSQHDWLDPSNRQDNTCVDACEPPSNPVDKKLAQFGSFQVGFRLLFADDPSWLRGVLRDSVSTAESLQNESDGTKWRRLQDIGEVFQWTSTELKLARIAMHADDVSEFAEWLDDLPNVSRDAAKTYARVLGANANAVRESSQRRSALMSCGLCCIERNEESSRGFAAPPRLHQKLLSILAMDDFDVGQLPLFLFSKSPQPTLVKTDFAHLKGEMTSLELLLRRATEMRERGINILIYGPPGTGKTEFARQLVASAELDALEVPATDRESAHGTTNAVGDRLALLRSAHWLLQGTTQTILIFDEAEDAFPQESSPWLGGRSKHGVWQGSRKAWVNQLLEETPLPTIWISNAVHQMDAAFVRRFTYHLEMRRPTQRVRERIAMQRAIAHLMPESVAKPLGAYVDASPAAINSALRFAKLAWAGDDGRGDSDTQVQLAERSLCASLRASGLQARTATRVNIAQYQPEFVNVSGCGDMSQLIEELASVRACNLCFYGVPGTGKTSYAEHIARALDRPLIVRRASDLQSMWLGETEKLIRAAFDEAQDEGGVLLIDEADSFLSDRSAAFPSWERSQVNELLQCMERFDGIFIAATNMIEALDKASLRRFTYKVEFLPLSFDQRIAMLQDQLRASPVSDEEWLHLRNRLGRLDGLTVGDFAIVAAQSAVRKRGITAEERVAMLEAELRLRLPSRGRVLGFL